MVVELPLKAKAKKRPSDKTKVIPKAFDGTKANPALDLRQRLQLNQPIFARLLAVSVRSLATLESGSSPAEAVARRLNELVRLTNALEEVINNEALGRWLQAPNQAFNGLKPLEVIDRGETDRIWAMIYFLRSGVPA